MEVVREELAAGAKERLDECKKVFEEGYLRVGQSTCVIKWRVYMRFLWDARV